MLHIVNGDHDHPSTKIRWSAQFRRLLGYGKLHQFPHGWDSWLQAVHADDQPLVLAAFGAHINDSSAAT